MKPVPLFGWMLLLTWSFEVEASTTAGSSETTTTLRGKQDFTSQITTNQGNECLPQTDGKMMHHHPQGGRRFRFGRRRRKVIFDNKYNNIRGGGYKKRLKALPSNVSEDSINQLVKEILKDPTINIRLMPDRIEKILYKTTVRLTLNAIYSNLIWYDGQPFVLGHKLRMQYDSNTTSKTTTFYKATKSNVDVKVLEEVADRLLSNNNINQPLIPDVLERQIYINCLKVVLRVLDIVQSSLRLNFCGHSLGLYLKQQQVDDNDAAAAMRTTAAALRQATSILSQASQEQIEEFQRESGMIEDGGVSNSMYLFNFFGRYRRALLSQVHATMFGLVLQIIQDVLDQSRIEFVGIGEIYMDLVEDNKKEKKEEMSLSENGEEETALQMSNNNVVANNNKSTTIRNAFISGLGIGAALVVVIVNYTNPLQIIIHNLNSWMEQSSYRIEEKFRLPPQIGKGFSFKRKN